MLCLKQVNLLLTILVILTSIMYQSFVMATPGLYNAFIDLMGTLPVTLKLIKRVEDKCRLDKDSQVLVASGSIDLNKLSVALVKDKTHEYIKLSQLNEVQKMRLYNKDNGIVIIIPGYKTSIKKRTPKSVVELVYYIRNNVKDKNIFVFDADQYLTGDYEQSALYTIQLGKYLGQSLAKIPQPKNIHLIGIDLGANIAVLVAQEYFAEKNIKITRISGLNPATLCVPILGEGSADFVDIYRTSGFYGEDEKSGTITFQVREQESGNSCSSFMCSTNSAVEYYADLEKKKYVFKKCGADFKNCETDLEKYGYELEMKGELQTFERIIAMKKT